MLLKRTGAPEVDLYDRAVDRSLLWRAALVQALAVAALFAVLALSLPRSFFEDWGAVVGPAGWTAASLVTWRVLRLPLGAVAAASAVSGAAAALVGALAAHAVSLPVAIALFALICASAGRRPLAVLPTEVVNAADRWSVAE